MPIYMNNPIAPASRIGWSTQQKAKLAIPQIDPKIFDIPAMAPIKKEKPKEYKPIEFKALTGVNQQLSQKYNNLDETIDQETLNFYDKLYQAEQSGDKNLISQVTDEGTKRLGELNMLKQQQNVVKVKAETDLQLYLQDVSDIKTSKTNTQVAFNEDPTKFIKNKQNGLDLYENSLRFEDGEWSRGFLNVKNNKVLNNEEFLIDVDKTTRLDESGVPMRAPSPFKDVSNGTQFNNSMYGIFSTAGSTKTEGMYTVVDKNGQSYKLDGKSLEGYRAIVDGTGSGSQSIATNRTQLMTIAKTMKEHMSNPDLAYALSNVIQNDIYTRTGNMKKDKTGAEYEERGLRKGEEVMAEIATMRAEELRAEEIIKTIVGKNLTDEKSLKLLEEAKKVKAEARVRGKELADDVLYTLDDYIVSEAAGRVQGMDVYAQSMGINTAYRGKDDQKVTDVKATIAEQSWATNQQPFTPSIPVKNPSTGNVENKQFNMTSSDLIDGFKVVLNENTAVGQGFVAGKTMKPEDLEGDYVIINGIPTTKATAFTESDGITPFRKSDPESNMDVKFVGWGSKIVTSPKFDITKIGANGELKDLIFEGSDMTTFQPQKYIETYFEVNEDAWMKIPTPDGKGTKLVQVQDYYDANKGDPEKLKIAGIEPLATERMGTNIETFKVRVLTKMPNSLTKYDKDNSANVQTFDAIQFEQSDNESVNRNAASEMKSQTIKKDAAIFHFIPVGTEIEGIGGGKYVPGTTGFVVD